MADDLLQDDFDRLPSQDLNQKNEAAAAGQAGSSQGQSRFNPSGQVEDIFENTEKPDRKAGQAGFKVKPANDLGTRQEASGGQAEYTQIPLAPSRESQKPAKPSLSKSFTAVSKPQSSRLTGDAEFDDEPIPSKKKYFIFGLLGLAVLAGGAAYWFIFRPAPEEAVIKSNSQPLNGTVWQESQPVNNQAQDQPVTQTPEQDIISNPDTGAEVGGVIADSDQDGLSDDEEASLVTDPLSPDSDNDGLFDREEARVYLTDPLNADSDNDGYLDGEEVVNGFNPKGFGSFLPPIRQ